MLVWYERMFGSPPILVAGRGLEPTKRETCPNGVRKVTYRDPDGSAIGFGGTPR